MRNAADDQRVRSTRAQLRKAYTALLSEKPVNKVTVAELCDRAGIHRSTFYAHFKDIYDLQSHLEDELFSEFIQTIAHADLSAIKLQDPVPRFMVMLFDFIKRNEDLCQVFLSENSDGRFVMRILMAARESTLEDLGLIYKKASASQLETYFTFMASGCIGLLEFWLRNGLTESAEEMARITNLMTAGGTAFLENPSAS